MTRKQRRATFIALGLGILAVAVGLVLNAMRDNIVFFYSPTDVVEKSIAPGTRWEDVPETWTCPDCGVTKSDFEMVEVD